MQCIRQGMWHCSEYSTDRTAVEETEKWSRVIQRIVCSSQKMVLKQIHRVGEIQDAFQGQPFQELVDFVARV